MKTTGAYRTITGGPSRGTIEWILRITLRNIAASATVYWFDDAPWGGCRVPKAWRIYYKDTAGEWCPVQNADSYGVVKGALIQNFDPVKRQQ